LRGFVPGGLVAEVLDRTDIVALIGEHVRLVKKGQRYVGLCPFHQERTPSFTVSPEKQFFYCFGCGTGGDALKFLILREQLTFREALQRLADRAGVKLPEARLDPAALQRQREVEEACRINELAARFFTAQLREAGGEPARQYLEKRGITPEIASKFGLGFAPPSRGSLLQFLQRQGLSSEEALRYGLAVRLESGEVVERFRGRLIFPISDARGRVRGFGGRALNDTAQPKYLNSPEAPFFNKRELLYALFQARDAIRTAGFAVIVEGYLDAVTAHQFGFCNVVASLGTSLTREQGRLLLRYAGTVVIAYDSDAAGAAATLRGLDLLQELGFRVRVVSIPRGKDPDEFLRTAGREAWERAVAGAVPFLEYKGLFLAEKKGIGTAAEKMAVLQALIPNLALLPTVVEREEGIQAVSRITGLNWEIVRGELDRFLEKGQKSWLNTCKTAKNKHVRLKDARRKAEAGVLKFLLERPDSLPRVEAAGGSELFSDLQHRRVYAVLRDVAAGGELHPPSLFARLDEEDKEIVATLLAEQPFEGTEALLTELIGFIRRRARREQRQELLLGLKAAEEAGDREQVQQILSALQTLISDGKEGW
jgi:DNA primase